MLNTRFDRCCHSTDLRYATTPNYDECSPCPRWLYANCITSQWIILRVPQYRLSYSPIWPECPSADQECLSAQDTKLPQSIARLQTTRLRRHRHFCGNFRVVWLGFTTDQAVMLLIIDLLLPPLAGRKHSLILTLLHIVRSESRLLRLTRYTLVIGGGSTNYSCHFWFSFCLSFACVFGKCSFVVRPTERPLFVFVCFLSMVHLCFRFVFYLPGY